MAILVGVDVRSEGKLRVLDKGVSDIGIGTIGMSVFSFEDIIHPVKHFLRDSTHFWGRRDLEARWSWMGTDMAHGEQKPEA